MNKETGAQKKRKKQNGFTILEMMIVMLVVAVLLIITLPNIQQKEKIIRNKGCSAMLEVINSQILLFEIEHDRTPSDVSELLAEGYLKEAQTVCPDGSTPYIENGQAVSR
ncbi:competence type IV pilus major pilin ComGC [uncultured Faecalibaculum sp.]|uniref:competence type IV pilus major pilin ComGC n=1 Tax=uncultured Faecalibaculum sp. TaxID=1729681 RepID=UPI0025D2BF0D|nr:competence type IV pilus major pilin ComGC [uncultured Faecalibaculum sp.]